MFSGIVKEPLKPNFTKSHLFRVFLDKFIAEGPRKKVTVQQKSNLSGVFLVKFIMKGRKVQLNERTLL